MTIRVDSLKDAAVNDAVMMPPPNSARPSSKPGDFVPQRSIESYGLLDLYSHDAFLTVLHTPRIYEAFAEFLRSEHSSENLVFWSRCVQYKQYHRELSKSISLIDHKHLQVGAAEEINVPDRKRTEGFRQVGNLLLAMEETEQVFGSLQSEVEMMMWRDPYPRFLKHHLAYNASKSLEWHGPGKMTFKGLGECFCLTDPRYLVSCLLLIYRKPDNPIVLVSDAFIQVTGFPVSKIINHNCRFLQGQLSDRATVGRIREAITEGRESTEVFLNYRNDGTPFWNLLLVGTFPCLSISDGSATKR
jgi:PAS domain-containing protein